MAWLDCEPSGFLHVCFRLGDRKFKKSLRTKDKRRADASCSRLEENIRLVELGRLEIPLGADVPAFLLSDGKLNGKPNVLKSVTLGKVFSKYCDALPADSLEPETLRVAKIHMGHIERFLGSRFAIERLGQQNLQDFVLHRSKQKGKRGKALSAVTIKKELSTFSTVWSWATSKGYVSGPLHDSDSRANSVSASIPRGCCTCSARSIAYRSR